MAMGIVRELKNMTCMEKNEEPVLFTLKSKIQVGEKSFPV